MATQSPYHGVTKINRIEIVHPGVAFTWVPDSTGLLVETNLTVDDINNRTDKPVMFSSETEVWGWAKRISRSPIDYPTKVTYHGARG